MSTDTGHLKWLRDRLVHVYGESPNVDFVARLDRIIRDHDAILTELSLARRVVEAAQLCGLYVYGSNEIYALTDDEKRISDLDAALAAYKGVGE